MAILIVFLLSGIIITAGAQTRCCEQRTDSICHDCPSVYVSNSGSSRLALRTNLLYDVAIVPNIGIEYFFDSRWSLAANVMYIWLKNDSAHWYWRLFSADMEGRYWFNGENCRIHTGHHLGLYGAFYRYDFEFGGPGWMGDANYGGGISYGYALPLSRRCDNRLTLDFNLGLGYLGGTHKEYIPDDGCYVWQRTMRHRFFGPTKLEATLVWRLPYNNGGHR